MIKDVNLMMERSLSSDDYYVLSLLYLPLISNDAYSLYMSLAHLVNKETLQMRVSTDDLVKYLNLDYLKLEEVREELEGLALVNTYSNKEELIIKINNPLDANMLLNDSGLGVYLLDLLGEADYKKLASRFRIVDLRKTLAMENYDEVTRSFTDKFSSVTKLEFYRDFYRNKNTCSELNFQNPFDYDEFYRSLNDIYKRGNAFDYILKDKNFKDDLRRYSFMYHLDEEQLASAFNKAFINGLEFSKDKFVREIKAICNYENKNSDIQIIPNNVKPLGDTKIYYTDFKTFMDNFTKSSTPADIIDEIDKIRMRTNLSVEVMNFTYAYITKKNDNSLVSISTLDKWCRNLKYNEIDTIDEAKLFIDERYSKASSFNNNNYRKEKKVEVPDWYEDYKTRENDSYDYDLVDSGLDFIKEGNNE